MAHFHPFAANEDGLFNTVTGGIVNIHFPTHDSMQITDIAAALSKICRFGGQITEFYSVAQHSVYVCALAPSFCKLEALLHDAPEAYIGDVISPLKHILKLVYKPIEERFEQAIERRFGLSTEYKDFIKRADMFALQVEHRALQQGDREALLKELRVNRLPEYIWPPHVAEQLFIETFCKYSGLNQSLHL
ncbi:MAG TPA: hypothetical protein PKM63_21755 [Panacibacter sp.]|nr:hypothetical protein [Panacibacter sp.]HNP46938.1 hypothetical protein [Panacibacter sp.]